MAVDDWLMGGLWRNQNGNKKLNLHEYSAGEFSAGRPKILLALWLLVEALLVSSWIPGSWHRRAILRFFGAKVGEAVVIKPGVRIKYPWRLTIGNNSWIGERSWIDNLAAVSIGQNVCISQGVYICTGSHDWQLRSFDLIVEPISIGNAAWIGAQSIIGPGVNVGTGAVLCLGSLTTQDMEAWTIYRGNPVAELRKRSVEH